MYSESMLRQRIYRATSEAQLKKIKKEIDDDREFLNNFSFKINGWLHNKWEHLKEVGKDQNKLFKEETSGNSNT